MALRCVSRVRLAAAASAVVLSLSAAAGSARAAYVYDPGDFAVEVVSSTGLPANSLYSDPQAVLGRPTLKFNNGSAANPDFRRAKLIEAPFNTGTAGERLITTFNAGQAVTVRMGRAVTNDPSHAFGVDLIVYGNSFYGGTGGFVSDATNLNTFTLGSGAFTEKVKVSVSPDNVNWYRYDNGPYGDGVLPTNSYLWDKANAAWTDVEADPTKPVDPSLSVAGRSAADALADVYAGAAGGTGFDLAESGFSSIQYVRFEGLTGFAGGEIDAVAGVRSVPEPAGMAAGLLVAWAAGRRYRRRPR